MIIQTDVQAECASRSDELIGLIETRAFPFNDY